MYNIRKILNNNALLVVGETEQTESILLGKGIGFGKKIGDCLQHSEAIKEYRLAQNDGRTVAIGTENGIEPVYLEAAGRIIEEAERVFDKISSDILLPNPFIPDIKVLFGKEYAVAMKSRDIIKEYAGYEITDDEAGFIALHIHSGLSHEQVSETMKYTQIINQSMQMIVEESQKNVQEESLAYTRLLSHLYYILVREKNGGRVGVDLNAYMMEKYSRAMVVAKRVCRFMENAAQISLDELEQGYLAVHIEAYFAEL